MEVMVGHFWLLALGKTEEEIDSESLWSESIDPKHAGGDKPSGSMNHRTWNND